MQITNFFKTSAITALCVSSLLFSNTLSAQSQVTARIVGGSDVDSAETYPWMTSIQTRFGDAFFDCGATLIDESWLLTAAHCLEDEGQGVAPENINIYIKDYNFVTTTGDVIRSAQRYVVHPGYTTNDDNNDIALIKLASPVSASTIVPVFLARADYTQNTTLRGSSLKVMGWGVTEQDGNDTPAILQEADMFLVADDICDDTYSDLHTSQICAGVDEGGVDTCQGDSGGPLLFRDGEDWVQVGITSSGRGCAQASTPGLYTDVTQFIGWIENNIGAIQQRSVNLNRVTTRATSKNISLVAGRSSQSAPVSPAPAPVSSGGGGGGGGGGIAPTGIIVLLYGLLFAGRRLSCQASSKHAYTD